MHWIQGVLAFCRSWSNSVIHESGFDLIFEMCDLVTVVGYGTSLAMLVSLSARRLLPELFTALR